MPQLIIVLAYGRFERGDARRTPKTKTKGDADGFPFRQEIFRAFPSARRQATSRVAFGAVAALAFASLHAQTVPVEQFGSTAVNSNGNALYNVP